MRVRYGNYLLPNLTMLSTIAWLAPEYPKVNEAFYTVVVIAE